MMTEAVTVAAGEESEANLQVRARKLVRAYYNQLVERGTIEFPKVTTQQVYVVWFSKTLGNWKAMVGTVNPDSCYFEVTHNGETEETYVDLYEKLGQMVVSNPSIAQERRERDEMRADILRAAEHSARTLKEQDYANDEIAEAMGISESVVQCLLISGRS
jgi:hypothetical protein